MPRLPRHFEPDTIYHVTSRGVEQRVIFLSDSDKRFFLVTLLKDLRKARCALLAYCLMDNHFHLLIATSTVHLAIPLQSALTRYALRFNRNNKRVGHLFQGRYCAKPCRNLSYLHRVIAYIHLNPVRAGIVDAPEKWGWSSHSDWSNLRGSVIDFGTLTELTDVSAADFRDVYLEGLAATHERRPQGLSIPQLIEYAAAIMGVTPEDIISGNRGNAFTRAKLLLIDCAQVEGYELKELAHALGCTTAALRMMKMRRV